MMAELKDSQLRTQANFKGPLTKTIIEFSFRMI